jgi:2-dehydro-3-deoxygalactonokinase
VTPRLVALDWGTSSLRAYLLGADGAVLDSARADEGIMQLAGGDFAGAFERIAGAWRRRWPGLPALAAGMIGSAQGWVEAPYLPCPAGAEDLATALTAVPGDALLVVPGVAQLAPVPNVMRGEEAQVFGALALRPELAGRGRLLLPGTHAKWVTVADGRITGFETYMTGELFAVLRSHSILGRFAPDGAPAPSAAAGDAAFLRGVAAARAGDGIAGLLFSARALVLTGGLAPGESLDYLSGLLIGDEIRAARPDPATPLLLVGDPALCARYARALAAFGVTDAAEVAEATVTGLWRIACVAGLVANGKEDSP